MDVLLLQNLEVEDLIVVVGMYTLLSLSLNIDLNSHLIFIVHVLVVVVVAAVIAEDARIHAERDAVVRIHVQSHAPSLEESAVQANPAIQENLAAVHQ